MNTSSLMTAAKWLSIASKKLRSSGITSAYLDSLILVEDQLNLTRTKLLLSVDSITLSDKDLHILNKNLNRRITGEPLAYIRKSIDFYGNHFYVDRRVLVPRPESEAFIELLKTINIENSYKLADIGSGSGALGITVKLMFPSLQVDLIEYSKDAINVLISNLEQFKVSANIINADLLKKNFNNYQIVLANLPYVPNDYPINLDASFEPKIAIFGGKTGLEIYEELITQISNLNQKPKYLLFESLLKQHSDMKDLTYAAGYKLKDCSGLVQLFQLKSLT